MKLGPINVRVLVYQRYRIGSIEWEIAHLCEDLDRRRAIISSEQEDEAAVSQEIISFISSLFEQQKH